MEVILQIIAIVISLLLVIMVLLQVKGGLGGALLGGDVGGGIARTRRGLEKTLFQITIAVSVAFMAVSILAVALTR
jgi:preprotein translocase subunit SecG